MFWSHRIPTSQKIPIPSIEGVWIVSRTAQLGVDVGNHPDPKMILILNLIYSGWCKKVVIKRKV